MSRFWAGMAALWALACGGAADVESAECDTEARQDIGVRVQAAYYERGYLAARVDTGSEDACGEPFTIAIDEGPRYRYGRIEIDDPDADPETIEHLRAIFSFPTGDFFDHTAVAWRARRVRREYRDAGHALVEVGPETILRDRDQEVDIHVRIRRGPEVRIERIEVRGADPETCALARDQLLVAPGELYNETRLEQSRLNIEALNRFVRVDVSDEYGSNPDAIIVQVHLVEVSS